MMTPKPIAAILDSPLTSLVSRILASFLFLAAFVEHLRDLHGLRAYVATLGVRPYWLVMGLTLLIHPVGAALVITDRMTWLGAGMLAVFTVLTVPLAHHFWDMTGPQAVIEQMFSEEHVSVIGGLMAVCIASRARALARHTAEPSTAAGAEANRRGA